MTKILCDTHIYFWWITNDPKLPRATEAALEDRANEVFISSVVPWELATKSRIGKWPSARIVLESIEDVIQEKDLRPLAVTLRHGRIAGLLPGSHRDPFDRMLAAQAEVEGLIIATVDSRFIQFGVRTLSRIP
jgi:PIN domain nuclease of toxin-antitoxin system